jgi:hypothetical protein
MNHDNDDQPGLLGRLKNRWRTESGWKKVMWVAVALLAAYFVYKFKKEWDKAQSERAERNK